MIKSWLVRNTSNRFTIVHSRKLAEYASTKSTIQFEIKLLPPAQSFLEGCNNQIVRLRWVGTKGVAQFAVEFNTISGQCDHVSVP